MQSHGHWRGTPAHQPVRHAVVCCWITKVCYFTNMIKDKNTLCGEVCVTGRIAFMSNLPVTCDIL